ncbi:MAG: type II secretion system F family protein [Candidatus Omnitrophota bacterium]
MPNFNYKVRDRTGKAIAGVISAKNTEMLIEYFKNMGYTPIKISEQKGLTGILNLKRRLKTISLKDINMMTRQLATFEGAGMPIMTSLRALEDQTENWRLKEIVSKIKKDIEAGSEFSDSLGRFSNVFSTLYINMVRAGESSGKLHDILLRIAELGEKEDATSTQIKTATRYPMVVLIAIFAVFIGITTFILPKFAALFAKFNTELPLPTRVMLKINELFQSYWYIFLILIILLITGFKFFLRTKIGNIMWSKFILKVPVFGKIINNAIMARFSRILGTLMQSGLPVLKALDITKSVLGNVVVMQALDDVRDNVKEGRGMADPLALHKVFPPMVVHMVAAGEESGTVDTLLIKISEHFDSEVDSAVKNMTTLIEPILIVVLALIVLGLALAIFLPMWNMSRLFLK